MQRDNGQIEPGRKLSQILRLPGIPPVVNQHLDPIEPSSGCQTENASDTVAV